MGGGAAASGSRKTTSEGCGTTLRPPSLLPVHLPGSRTFSLAVVDSAGRSRQTAAGLAAGAAGTAGIESKRRREV